jgi:hypothetical protein
MKDLYFLLIGCVVLLFAVIAAAVRFGYRDRVGQIATAFVFLEISGLFAWMALDLEVSPLMDSSPATIPVTWSAALAFFSAYQLFRVLKGETEPDPGRGHIGRVLLTVAIVAACIIGIEYVGFYLATSGMIVLMLPVLGEYRPRVLLFSPLGWSLFAWVFFEKLLRLGLPVGSLWK